MKFKSDYQALAHHWVYNDDNSECYGNRMFSEGDKIYSYGYHYCIASKVRDKKGNVIFTAFNSHQNSVTTNKQRRIVNQAINGTIIEVPDPSKWHDWK